MAERCGSRVAHDWRGYEAVAVNRYCYDRGRGWPLIDAISDRTGRPRVLRASAPRRSSFALPVSLLATLKDVGRVAICSEVQC